MQSRQLKTVLLESLFNPQSKEIGSLRFVLEVDNPEYWLTRAMEYINEAQESYETHQRTLDDSYLIQTSNKLRLAISLLALTRCKIDEDDKAKHKT